MSLAASATRARPDSWPQRVRFVLAILVVWAGLHFVVGLAVLPRLLDRPLVLLDGSRGLLAGLLFVIVIWSGAALAGLLLGPGDRARPMLAIGLALAIWAAEAGRQGGTMDDWLIRCNPVPGPPHGGPYWRLLPDYVFLILGVSGAYALTGLVHEASERRPSAVRLRAAFQPVDADSRARGPVALLIAAAAGGVMSLVLSAPAVSETYRGQVYFAIGLGSFAGVFAARQTVGVRDPLWYWPVPLLIGVVGLIVAAVRPGLALPAAYPLDTIPAWGLARGLPVELVGAGLVGALWNLNAAGQEAARSAT